MRESWKSALQDRMPPDLSHEIDLFEGQMELRRQDRLDEKVFAETRLRRGIYGQRYDNGQRHDGIETRPLNFPSDDLTKGPDTMWERARHAAHQGALRRPFAGANGDPGGPGRGILQRHFARHHAPGLSAALHSHRRHAPT